MGFPGGSDSKDSTCNAGDLGLIPGLGRSPGGGVESGAAPEEVVVSTMPTKIIENGQVYILRNGVRYNLLGRTAQ